MPEYAPLVLSALFGFALSGCVASAWRLAAGGRPMPAVADRPLLAAAAIAGLAFAGPYLSLSMAWSSWRSGELAAHWLAAALLACCFWSFCCGVLALQALWAANLIAA